MTSNNHAIFALDENSKQSKKVQIYKKIKDAIIAGFWSPQEALPSAEDISDATSIPEYLIDEVLEELTSESWLRQSGDNFFLTPKVDQPIASLSSLSDMLKSRGFSIETKWINKCIAQPTLEEQYQLDLDDRTAVARLERIRISDGIVLGYEITTLPEKYLPKPNEIGTSLYSYLESKNLQMSHATEEITAHIAEGEIAQHCKINQYHPMLRLTRVSFLPTGEPLEFTHSYFRSDLYRYVVQLHH